MESIRAKVWSHRTATPRSKQYVREVRRSKPKEIKTYRELVIAVAQIAYNNRQFNLLFRGQDRDYQDKDLGTVLLPKYYRARTSGDPLLELTMEQRAILLNRGVELLGKAKAELNADNTFDKHEQIKWAILQHYNVCPTPLLDLTASLRVACSFALLQSNNGYGIVYVIGLPHVNGSISFFVEEELILLKLLSICPPTAVRPYFQDGFLAGSFPGDLFSNRESLTAAHIKEFDFAQRLIAKFKITRQGFWDEDFTEIPEFALYPKNDQAEKVCNEIRVTLEKERQERFAEKPGA